MIRPFIKRSRDRRRSSNSSVNKTAQLRRSSSPGLSQNGLSVPSVEAISGSLNNLTIPQHEVRRCSYPGYCSGNKSEPLIRRKSSTASKLPYASFGFNPVVKKLRYRCVLKVLCGLALLFIAVLFLSIYRLVTWTYVICRTTVHAKKNLCDNGQLLVVVGIILKHAYGEPDILPFSRSLRSVAVSSNGQCPSKVTMGR